MGASALCTLRTQRRLWGLNQQELATLLGVRGPDQISRLERGDRTPPFKVAIAIELLFNVPAAVVFPKFRAEVEELFMTRAYALHQSLLVLSSAKAERKRQLLETALRRGTINLKRGRV